MSFDTDPSRNGHMLTAEDIWAAQDIEELTVPVPQWGGSVRIRTLSKKQFDSMRKRATVKDRGGKETLDNELLEAFLFCEGMVEPHIEVVDYDRIQAKSAAAVTVVTKAIIDASGLSELAVSEADKSLRARPDAVVRVLPRAGVADDTGGTPAQDVGA